MLAIILSSLLLASAALPEARLTLEPRAANQLELTLCFRGAGGNIRFELEVENASKAGLNRSRQAGAVAISVKTVCPLHNRLSLAGGESSAVLAGMRPFSAAAGERRD